MSGGDEDMTACVRGVMALFEKVGEFGGSEVVLQVSQI